MTSLRARGGARLTAVGVLLAALTAVPALPARAAAPVPGEYVFVMTPNNHSYYLYAANATTGARRRITTKRAVGRPSYSPTGSTIAFTGPLGDDSDGRYGIYTVNRTGTGLRRVTAPTFADFDPAWSPNGAWIAFSRDRKGSSAPSTCCRIALVKPDGTSSRWVYNTDGGSFPAWSPDSTRLAYVRPDGLYVIRTNGTGRKRIATGKITTPEWSPDGTTIAYAQRTSTYRSQIRVIPSGGGTARVRWAPTGHVESPVWGLDGHTLNAVFHRGWGDWARRSSSIYRISPTGGASRQVNPAPQVYYLDYHHLLRAPGSTTVGLVDTDRANLEWRLNNGVTAPTQEPATLAYGQRNDIPVTGDWDGDGIATPGFVRNNGGYLDWYVAGPDSPTFRYGVAGDTPVTGDWNGDGIDTAGAVRLVDGYLNWFLTNRSTYPTTQARARYGVATDSPVSGDWDRDGVTTIGVARHSGPGLEWFLSNRVTSAVTAVRFSFGLPTDRPVTGDWNGDRADTIGVVRTIGDGLQWQLRDSNSAGAPSATFDWGSTTQTPVTGDWDGR